jgi:hypothetical protein
MKFIKLLIMCLVFTQGKSQLTIESQVNVAYPVLTNVSAGYGFGASYSADGRIYYSLSFNYYGTSGITINEYFTSGNSSVDPSQIKLDVDYSFKGYDVSFGLKTYFYGDFQDDFGLYGFVGGGIYYAPVTAKVPSYNEEDYFGTRNGKVGNLFAFTGHAGIGAEKNIGFGSIFAEVKGVMPLTDGDASTDALPISSPLTLNLGIGIRVLLF